MKAADWIVDFLISRSVTDAFGLPGAVILDLLYAMDRRKPELTPHLSYHEQGAAFAACGYAQATGKLGVAYATRGPGMTNMLTAIADAYYDSIPVMFFTAHNSREKMPEMRVENNQEIDTVAIVSNVTKYAARIDEALELQREIQKAYAAATTGRKGPVFLDIDSSVLRQEISVNATPVQEKSPPSDIGMIADDVAAKVRDAARPMILIGNGVRQSEAVLTVRELAEKAGIPVLSSRAAHDVLPGSPMYYGFIGSHGTRYGNFILSKADLILALGNRMAFPQDSKSFQPVVEKAATIRVDIDGSEFLRKIPGSICYKADLQIFLPELLKKDLFYSNKVHWIEVCETLKQSLNQWDKTPIIAALMHIVRAAEKENVFVCDVGNHSFWVTNACIYSNAQNRVLYSNSFGTLGSALPKALGAYYGTGRPVICFSGDQGFQMNIQEVQAISQCRLPVTIVVINNFASAMIREREEKQYPYFVHTTKKSGYEVPDLQALASAYRLEYRCVEDLGKFLDEDFAIGKNPCLVDLRADGAEALCPNLPQGRICQNLAPSIPEELYQRLENLR